MKIKVILSCCTTLIGCSFITIPTTNSILNISQSCCVDSNKTNHLKNTSSIFSNANFDEFAIGKNLKGTLSYDLDNENQCVKIIEANNVSGIDITFKEKVLIQNKEYSITSINSNAFSGCSNLIGSITFNQNIISIGDHAFENCTGLTSLFFNQNLKSIGDSAFKKCTNIKLINSFDNLTYLGKSAFQECENLSSNITIPNQITIIPEFAFKNTSIKSIVLPSSLVEIKDNAISDCNFLESISIPNSVKKIGDYAFANCTKLLNVQLPNNLPSIPDYCFKNCKSLISVIIPNSVKKIGSFSFASNSKLKTLSIDENNSKLLEIGTEAFANCNDLEMFNLPKKLEKIGNNVFKNCTSFIGEIYIPNSVKYVGKRIYRGCSKLNVPEKGTHYSSSKDGYNKWNLGYYGTPNDQEEIIIEDGTYGISANAYFYDFYPIKDFNINLTLNKEITVVCDYAFYNAKIQKMNLNALEKIEYIGNESFTFNNGINSDLFFPSTLKYIGGEAFARSNITSIKFANNSKNKLVIGDRAFAECYSLSGKLNIPTYVTKIGSTPFIGCTKLDDFKENQLYYSSDEEGYAKWCVGNLSSKTTYSEQEVVIEENTIGVCGGIFQNNLQLKSVEIPASVKYIGDSAFNGCNELKNAKILNSNLISIGDYAFLNCNSLEYIPIDLTSCNNLTSIGDYAFSGCSKMKWSNSLTNEIKLSHSLENIGESAFNGCKELDGNIIFSNNKLDLESKAIFKDCINLTNIDMSNSNIKTIGESAFEGCSNLKAISIPTSVKLIDKNAFLNCLSASSLSFDENSQLEVINSYAFKGCENLKGVLNQNLNIYEIVMPSSLKEIGESAFEGDKNINRITFNSNIAPRIGDNWLEFIDDSLRTKIVIPYGSKPDYFNTNIGISADRIKYFDITSFELIAKNTIISIDNSQKTVLNNFYINANEKCDKNAIFTIECISNNNKNNNWLKIDKNSGEIIINENCIEGVYEYIVTATSTVDPTISSSAKITLNISSHSNKTSKYLLWSFVFLGSAICLIGIWYAIKKSVQLKKNNFN